MNLMIPKSERKAALFSVLALVALTAIICTIQLSTRHLNGREYLLAVGLGAACGAMGGAVFGYIGRLCVSAVRRVMVICFGSASHGPQPEIEQG